MILGGDLDIRWLWGRFNKMPRGNRLFSYALGKMAPYSGTVDPVVLELEPGHSKVLLKDRKKVRNHLNSIHAIAIANVGEMSTGLALLASVPKGWQAIIRSLNISYEKKARGAITFECKWEVPDYAQWTEAKDVTLQSHAYNAEGQVVATTTAVWRVRPNKKAEKKAE